MGRGADARARICARTDKHATYRLAPCRRKHADDAIEQSALRKRIHHDTTEAHEPMGCRRCGRAAARGLRARSVRLYNTTLVHHIMAHTRRVCLRARAHAYPARPAAPAFGKSGSLAMLSPLCGCRHARRRARGARLECACVRARARMRVRARRASDPRDPCGRLPGAAAWSSWAPAAVSGARP